MKIQEYIHEGANLLLTDPEFSGFNLQELRETAVLDCSQIF
jgi:hypothetical protein